MTTRSSPSQTNQAVIDFTDEIHWSGPPGGMAGRGDGECAAGDPVGGLVRAAVDDRPLEEVLRLVTLLEGSPEHTEAVRHALRAVALHRPVEDVARLVAELTRPPRPADGADETIRAAVGGRCVEDVTRLVVLLHRPPQLPHCGRAAIRAAAAGRTVEDLVELIGRLARERSDEPYDEPGATPGVAAGEEQTAAGEPGERPARPAFWPSWIAAAALVVCGAAYFPLRWQGVPLLVCLLALTVSGLCGLLAVLLALRAGVAALVAGAVVPAVLAGVGYVQGRFAPAQVSRALAITVAPPLSAGLTAVCASLASLAALSLLLMVQAAERHPPPRPAGLGSRAVNPPAP
ncbi:hypothetical protein ACWDAO_39230 [Streptomyces sp. NPDC001212]|uniref:hypothetical protein n=1 Tax=unclassified Streptomyces TaxID=2593676 RepID=UPI001CD2AE44|nr:MULTISPECIES: hypothetical protein [unclassified Streptomyces]